MTDKELCGKIIKLLVGKSSDWHKEYGEKMFELETTKGFPKEMFIDELKKIMLDLTKEDIFKILVYYLILITEHKIKSGMTEENIKKLWAKNKEIILKF